MAITMGMARRMYLKNKDPSEIKKTAFLDLSILNGRTSPMIMKFKMLNKHPRINPLPTATCSRAIQQRQMIIESISAFEQYFFCMCL